VKVGRAPLPHRRCFEEWYLGLLSICGERLSSISSQHSYLLSSSTVWSCVQKLKEYQVVIVSYDLASRMEERLTKRKFQVSLTPIE
jgi:hypothetical protein